MTKLLDRTKPDAQASVRAHGMGPAAQPHLPPHLQLQSQLQGLHRRP